MVYVDNYQAPFGKMVMCHMQADTTEELLAMVDKIGVQRKWIQYPGTGREHFDICLAKRKKAIAAGAQEVNARDLARFSLARSGPNDQSVEKPKAIGQAGLF